jgi:hypothetical protein
VHRHHRAGASELSTISRWGIGLVALVHVGIVALRLGIAALARRERRSVLYSARIHSCRILRDQRVFRHADIFSKRHVGIDFF